MVDMVRSDEVARLASEGAQLLEVLPPSSFQREHLPSVINIPLPDLTPQRADDLDRDRPVVVYCYDTECDLSARGAALLEAYGFEHVYDFRGSKTEWFGLGRGLAGDVGTGLRAVGIAREV